MASKRKPDQTESEFEAKKPNKKGFSVGPRNLPKGIHRQKGISFIRVEGLIISSNMT